MLIARQKLNENVAEYILYMYQTEDLIRAFDFNLDRIIDEYVRPQLPDNSFIDQYRAWYRDLVAQMKSQRIEKNGHLNELKELLVELSYLHNTLLNLANDEKYRTLFETATPYIDEFKEKSNLKDKNHVEIVLHALYMKLIMRISKKEISAETEAAFDAMRIMLAYLAKAYHEMKSGSLDFFNN